MLLSVVVNERPSRLLFAPFRPRSDLGPLAFHRNRAIFARTTALTVPAITARA